MNSEGRKDVYKICGFSQSVRKEAIRLYDLMMEMEKDIGLVIPIRDIAVKAKEKGIVKVEEKIDLLKKVGEVFEPHKGFLERI